MLTIKVRLKMEILMEKDGFILHLEHTFKDIFIKDRLNVLMDCLSFQTDLTTEDSLKILFLMDLVLTLQHPK